MLIVKPGLTDKDSEIAVTQTTPAAPALLSALDLVTGDQVRLVWSGTGPFYNVYFKVTSSGDPFTRANTQPLAGSATQYDLGGLATGTNYTFLVRGVNGAGTEGPDSNTLTATPSIDTSASRFQTPVWEVQINGSPEPKAVLTSVELGFGSDVSNAVFVIQEDPDTGSFPGYNDSVEVFVNGRRLLKGKIKGVTSHISGSGLSKTFTVLSNITKFQEKVVPPDKTVWNVEHRMDDLNFNKVKADQLLSSVLGFVTAGAPSEFPGEVNLTDQTLLDATETVLRKLGNFKVYFDQDRELLEAYRFGQGGNVTRQFTKGVNILDFSMTENRQDVVDKLTVIGPPRAIRERQVVAFQDTELVPDANGVLRVSFVLNKKNVREIGVEGLERAEPFVEFSGNVQVLPDDMGLSSSFSSVPGFAEWPFFPFAEKIGNKRGDIGFRPALKTLIPASTQYASVGTSIRYDGPDTVRVFISQVPKIYAATTVTAFVDKKKIGVIPADGPMSVTVLTSVLWFPGSFRVAYTRDGDAPQFSTGSGPVERTITDRQFQIFIDTIPEEAFTNETEVLALMQQRLQAEFERLNRPKISGTITVIGDETIDLKSTVLVNSQKLDMVKVLHNFTNGFTTQVALTNEPFVAVLVESLPVRAERRGRDSERIAATDFRISFQDAEVDKNITTQRRQEFQRRIEQAGLSFAAYQD